MPTKPATTRMIAERCGFGQSTVSMALRNDPRIPGATRAIILAAATQLGYRPDPHFARLMAGVKRRKVQRQAQPLAYVILWKSAQDHYLYRTYREYREGAQGRALEFGYTLEDFVVNQEGITPKRLHAIMRTRVIPGMLIAPAHLSNLRAGLHGLDIKLPTADYALSTIGFTLAHPAVNRATHDHALGTELVVEQLRKKKIRRIGLVCSRTTHVRVEGRWLAGFLLAQEELPARDRVRPLIADNIHDAEAFDAWFRQEKPEVIVAVEMDEVQRHLDRLRLLVPRDISLAHLDISGDSPAYAGIVQHNQAIGAAAFDLLLAQILRNERGVPVTRKTVMIEGSWQDGPTIRV